jgi:hypothetical protein
MKLNTLTSKLLLSLAVLGVTAATLGGTFSAFSSTSENTANTFAAGTVYVADNDAAAAMYSVSNQKPGDSVQKCITVTYTGSLAATVKLYTSSTIGSLGQYVDLTVEKGTFTSGTPAFPACTNFAGSSVFSGTLANFASTKNSYVNGMSVFPGSQTQWNQNDSVVFRFTLTLQDNSNANGGATALSTGSHALTWEAQNQ